MRAYGDKCVLCVKEALTRAQDVGKQLVEQSGVLRQRCLHQHLNECGDRSPIYVDASSACVCVNAAM